MSDSDGMPSGLSDEALARLLALRSRATAFAFALLRDFHSSEDAYQEAVVVAVRRIGEFNGGSIDAWFWVILRNVIGTRLRAVKRSRLLFDSAVVDRLEKAFLETAPRFPEEDEDLLVQCVGKLQGKAREALVWRFVDGLSFDEIAGRLNRTVEAAYSLVKRARGAVRECVEKRSGTRGGFQAEGS